MVRKGRYELPKLQKEVEVTNLTTSDFAILLPALPLRKLYYIFLCSPFCMFERSTSSFSFYVAGRHLPFGQCQRTDRRKERRTCHTQWGKTNKISDKPDLCRRGRERSSLPDDQLLSRSHRLRSVKIGK